MIAIGYSGVSLVRYVLNDLEAATVIGDAMLGIGLAVPLVVGGAWLGLRIAHDPPYTSKWNPIEHRLFSQVERAWRGAFSTARRRLCAPSSGHEPKRGLA